MRYILFGSCDFYYAKGGGHDFLGSAESVDSLANSSVLKQNNSWEDICWWHIFDTKTRKIVAGTDKQPHGADSLSVISDDIEIHVIS